MSSQSSEIQIGAKNNNELLMYLTRGFPQLCRFDQPRKHEVCSDVPRPDIEHCVSKPPSEKTNSYNGNLNLLRLKLPAIRKEALARHLIIKGMLLNFNLPRCPPTSHCWQREVSSCSLALSLSLTR